MTNRVAIYARLSVAGDADETGIDRQLSDSRAYAERLGATTVVEYVDDGIGAYNKRTVRPQFERLLEAVTDGRHDTVVAWRTDRLARQGRDAERLLDAVEGRARVVSVADGLDTGGPAGDFMLRMFVQVGNWESKGISTRVKRAHQSIAERGGYSGGPRGFGHNQNRTEVVPEEASAIRDAANRLLAGESVKSVLREWQSRGIVTSRGNAWQHAALVNLLQQPRMVGKRVLRGVEVRGFPPILEDDTWERMCALLTDPTRKPANPGGQARHLLTGLLRCAVCGLPMRAKGNAGRKNGPDYWTYGCIREPERPNACGGVYIKGSKTDEYIAGLVQVAIASPELARLIEGDAEDESEETALRRALTGARERRERAEAEYLEARLRDPLVSDAAYRTVLDKFRAEEDELARSLAAIDRSRVLTDAMHSPSTYWQNASLEQRRALVRLVFPEIKVLPAESLPEFPQRWTERRIVLTPAA